MAKSMRQQAAIAVNKKKRMMAKKSSAGKYKVGKMKHHDMDHNKDGRVDARDYAIMRKMQNKRRRGH